MRSSKNPIEAKFGIDSALKYLIEEKFINFLEVAEQDSDFRAEIPAFAAEIRKIFEHWKLAEFLDTARRTEQLGSCPVTRS